MLEEVNVNLAPVLNLLIYVVCFILVRFLYRFLLRKTFARKVFKYTKAETLKVMAEHYKEHEYNEGRKLEESLHDLNIDINKKYKLMWGPLHWNRDDFAYDYDKVNSTFHIENVKVRKNFPFYKMNVTKYRNSKDTIKYKDCVKESRDNKISDLID